MPKPFAGSFPAHVQSQFFNIDNGAGTTIDEPLFDSGPKGAFLVRVYAQYGEVCQTVAGANFKLGTTVGGADVVAATAYTNTAAVGTITAATILIGYIPPNTMVTVRHTGVAVTQTGTAKVVAEVVFLDE